jgi:hypothetical protein
MEHAFAILLALALTSPAEAQPPRRSAAPPPPAATASVIVTVTDGKGAPIPGAAVHVSGTLDRQGETAADGTLRLQGLRSGAYRFRFSRDGYITLERDVTVPAGQRTMDQDVMLSAAERTAAPPPAPETPKRSRTWRAAVRWSLCSGRFARRGKTGGIKTPTRCSTSSAARARCA